MPFSSDRQRIIRFAASFPPGSSERGMLLKVAGMWSSYSNEDFDVAQSVARMLTDEDRAAGREAPRTGYSKENFDLAQDVIRHGTGSVDTKRVLEIARRKKLESL